MFALSSTAGQALFETIGLVDAKVAFAGTAVLAGSDCCLVEIVVLAAFDAGFVEGWAFSPNGDISACSEGSLVETTDLEAGGICLDEIAGADESGAAFEETVALDPCTVACRGTEVFVAGRSEVADVELSDSFSAVACPLVAGFASGVDLDAFRFAPA
jgi:hypothetical protein